MTDDRTKILDFIDEYRGENQSGDEIVDGPGVAAKILQALPLEKRESLLQNIGAKSPEIFKKINTNFFRFDEIADLTDRSVQTLLKEIEHADLVLSFQTAPRNVQTKFLKNMSRNKAEILLQDIEQFPVTNPAESNQAKERIVQIIDELRTQGVVRSEGGKIGVA